MALKNPHGNRYRIDISTFFSMLLGMLLQVLRNALTSLSSYDYMNWILSLGSRKVPSGLPVLQDVEPVTSRCWRISGLNPGPNTLHGTNTYLIGTGDVRILIDTGEFATSTAWVKSLLKVLDELGSRVTVSDIILTHGHYDHCGGISALFSELKHRCESLPNVYKRRITKTGDGVGVECGTYPLHGIKCEHLTDGHEFVLKDKNGQHTTLRCLYAPGHTDDSVCIAVLEDFALLSGDSVLGCGTSVFEDLHDYMRTLHNIRALMLCQPICGDGAGADHIKAPVALRMIYPGHGPVVRTQALQHIDKYIENRNERERRICDVLAASASRYYTSLQLVPLVYGPLPWVVRVSAQGNLLHHLRKLRKEGKVHGMSSLDLWGWVDDKKEH
jgi:ribonuclease/clavin/mitogillin